MLFYRSPPFTKESRILFPELSIGDFGARCSRTYNSLYLFPGDWSFSDVVERFFSCMFELSTFYPNQLRGEDLLFTLFKPYRGSLKRLHLDLRHRAHFPWKELLTSLSQSLEHLSIFIDDWAPQAVWRIPNFYKRY